MERFEKATFKLVNDMRQNAGLDKLSYDSFMQHFFAATYEAKQKYKNRKVIKKR